jgi:hypothetical protein
MPLTCRYMHNESLRRLWTAEELHEFVESTEFLRGDILHHYENIYAAANKDSCDFLIGSGGQVSQEPKRKGQTVGSYSLLHVVSFALAIHACPCLTALSACLHVCSDICIQKHHVAPDA